jgi:hypothetical protein
MDKYYVLVAGNGETSRANLEALMEDHYYANGADGTLVLAFDTKPNKTQEFAAQFAKEKNKEIIMFSSQAADFSSFPKASFQLSASPIIDAVNMLKGEKSTAFLLWADEDNMCSEALTACTKADIPTFDLTDGLSPLKGSKTAKKVEAPVFPTQETLDLTAPSKDEDEYEDDTEDDDEEDSDVEEDAMENLYFGIHEIARIFAAAFADEMEARKKAKD